MENHFKKLCHRLPLFLIGIVAWSSLFVSCKDIYPYDDEEPDWLGESVYEYLVANGNYTNITKIIDDLDYKEVLSKTGSKTLFVANDEAFERFYQNNAWGITSYDQMTEAQKNLILKYSMINNAYLIETLSNYYAIQGGLQEGSAIRRVTSVSYLDTVPFVSGDQLPENSYWDKYRSKGLYLLQDASDWPLVHLLQKALDYNGISDADFKIMTGIERSRNDAYIFQNKVIERDIACKNGYVNVLEDVLTPPMNMANYISTRPELSAYSKMLDRFCAPFYDRANTNDYKELMANKNISFNDSIFELCYFSELGGTTTYPSGASIDESLMLTFDPGWNSYAYQYGSLQSDMAVIFAPTNDALDAYFNDGSGRALKERYLTWENVPNNILVLLLNRHMRESLMNSIPSNFYKMVDNSSSSLGADPSDIIDSLNYIGLNGLVYVTSKIYPPDDYVSVYGPALFSSKTTVLNWAIKEYLYNLYLNSMVNTYAFVAPTDNALSYYIDPVTYGTDMPSVLKFWYDASPSSLSVKATVYPYNKITGVVGDSLTTIDDESFVKSRLVRILDQSIIVSDFKNEGGSFTDGYYVTKDGNIVKVNDITNIDGQTSSDVMTLQGGNDILNNRYVHLTDSGIYHQENGTTFFIDSLYQTPFQSVYTVLSDSANYPSFNAFFKLLTGFPDDNVFLKATNYYGIDFNVKFFNTYRYTVYVPTKDAIDDAYRKGIIPTWDYINSVTDQDVKDSLITRMERFVRYHFQDNSVFIHSSQTVDGLYQTATIKQDTSESYHNTYINKFYRLGVESDGEELTLTTEYTGDKDSEGNIKPYTAKVVTTGGLYNLLTRDYVFNLNPSSLTSLTSTAYSSSEITTSSTAVIHQIDKVLRFE